MQLEFRLSLKDYQEASQAHLKLLSWGYFSFWFFIILGLILLTLFVIVGTKINIFVLVFCLFLWRIIVLNPYFSNPIQKYVVSLAWKGLPNLHHPITVEASEEILKIKTISSESSLQWQFCIKAIETKNLFMLYQAKALFNMIPKRAFNSDEQVNEFRELVRTKIEKFQQV